MSQSGTLQVQNNQDVVLVRQAVRQLTTELSFSLVDQTKMVTAASELARNTVIYGGGGVVDWAIVSNGERTGLSLTFKDSGVGIPDIQKAMTDGWTTGSGLGMGLPGARRLVNDFSIASEPGQGTTVTITRWK